MTNQNAVHVEVQQDGLEASEAYLRTGVLFVLGAPRSGTSWIQEGIAKHLNAATTPELHLFSDVVRPVVLAWRKRVKDLDLVLDALSRGGQAPERIIGLPAIIDEGDLKNLLRKPLEQIMRRAQEVDASVALLIEKTPSNSLLVPYILDLYPEAWFVHVVRDPRDVVRSLRSAGGGWAKAWAPRSALVGSLMWRAHVCGAREAVVAKGRYLEIRYEDARFDSARELSRIDEWISSGRSAQDLEVVGMPDLTAKEPQVLVSRRVRQVAGEGPIAEPADFGDGRAQRAELTPLQCWIVEAICGDVMLTYSYSPHYRSAIIVQRLIGRLLNSVSNSLTRPQKEYIALRIKHHRLLSLFAGVR